MNKEVDRIVNRYLDKVAANVVQDSKLNAPVKTGALRESIQSGKEGSSILIFSDIEYAKYVELGTRNQTPNPFLRTAARNRKNYIT